MATISATTIPEIGLHPIWTILDTHLPLTVDEDRSIDEEERLTCLVFRAFARATAVPALGQRGPCQDIAALVRVPEPFFRFALHLLDCSESFRQEILVPLSAELGKSPVRFGGELESLMCEAFEDAVNPKTLAELEALMS